MKEVLSLCEETRKQTDGYFDIYHKEKMDPSGLVKGWSVYNASLLLKKSGYINYYVEAGGDIQVSGKNTKKENWIIGIRNPFDRRENVKVISVDGCGVATSGTAIRGEHIYNPHDKTKQKSEIVSLTVIGPNVYEADRFATAAFAMDKRGISFIESLKGFEGYMIGRKGIATYTSGFEKYVLKA
jgi:thiamine biosynthesis lipoprotein